MKLISIDAQSLEAGGAAVDSVLPDFTGIVVPGGFGERGSDADQHQPRRETAPEDDRREGTRVGKLGESDDPERDGRDGDVHGARLPSCGRRAPPPGTNGSEPHQNLMPTALSWPAISCASA